MVPDDLFSYQDDGRSERSYFKDDNNRRNRDRQAEDAESVGGDMK
jgi:hypothetical protein